LTDIVTSVAIAAEIETLRADLATVSAAIPIIGKPAVVASEKIEKAIAKADDSLKDALENELIEAQKQRFANFSDIRIEYDKEKANLLTTRFKIAYTRLVYDSRLRDNVPKRHSCNGFAALEPDAYEYLLCVRPDAIPAPIMALAPNDPQEAFSIYLAGLARGYFKGRAV